MEGVEGVEGGVNTEYSLSNRSIVTGQESMLVNLPEPAVINLFQVNIAKNIFI